MSVTVLHLSDQQTIKLLWPVPFLRPTALQSGSFIARPCEHILLQVASSIPGGSQEFSQLGYYLCVTVGRRRACKVRAKMTVLFVCHCVVERVLTSEKVKLNTMRPLLLVMIMVP